MAQMCCCVKVGRDVINVMHAGVGSTLRRFGDYAVHLHDCQLYIFVIVTKAVFCVVCSKL